MKLNKLFLGLLGVAAFTLASCSDDDSYEKATVSGPQVFFSDTTPTAYEISPDATSFNVPISRADASGALTVNLTSTTENPMYEIPSSVSFNAGEATTNITVTYDPAKIEYGRYDNLTVKIADDSQSTSWGVQELAFTAGVTDWGPWQKWNSAGTATYIYVNFWSGDDPGLPFVYRHNMIKTNLYQFKLSNWGYGVDIIFDYDEETGYVTCAKQWTGYDHSSYGYVYAEDLNAYRAEKEAAPVETGYGSFDKEQGIITIPLAYVVSAGTFGYDPEYIYIDGYVRADYSSGLLYSGIFTSVEGSVFAVGQLTAGADVTAAKAVVLEADADAEAVADAIADGELEAIDVEPGTIYVPVPEGLTGKLQIVTAVIVNGEVKSVAAAPFEYYGGGKDPWQSIGVGALTDNFFITMYSPDGETTYDPQTFEVEIQENTDEPGLYRLVDPFQGYGFENYTATKFEINATDPDAVYFLLQATGVDDGDGMTYIASYGGYMTQQYDVATLKQHGYMGTLKDGVITFPVFTTEKGVNYQGVFAQGSSAWYTGKIGEFKLVLPSADASVRAKARSVAKASDFARRLKGNARKSCSVKANKILMGVALKSDAILR